MAEQEWPPAWLGLPTPRQIGSYQGFRDSPTWTHLAVVWLSHPLAKILSAGFSPAPGAFPITCTRASLPPTPPLHDCYQGPGEDSPFPALASSPANPLTGEPPPLHCRSQPSQWPRQIWTERNRGRRERLEATGSWALQSGHAMLTHSATLLSPGPSPNPLASSPPCYLRTASFYLLLNVRKSFPRRTPALAVRCLQHGSLRRAKVHSIASFRSQLKCHLL